MRITVVLQDLHDAGANRVSLDRAQRWQAAGHHVTVFVAYHERTTSPVPVPAGLVIRRATRHPRQLRTALPAAQWRLVVLALRSDVLVSGTEIGFGLLLAWVAGRVTRRPIAVTVQSRIDVALETYLTWWLRPPTRAALTHADLAVCVSQGVAPAMLALGLPVDRLLVVANAVDRVAVLAAAAQGPAVPPGAAPVVVGSGRLVRQKGFDLLLRAHAQALRAGAPAHRLLILGDGEEREALTRLAADLGVTDSVELAGFTANPHAVVARASLFVLSSRWEGMPLSLLEALACGTACVAFDCVAGPSEVLAGGAYGELVGEEDVDGLARAITAHLLDPAPLRDRARRAVSDDAASFDPELAASRHLMALTDVVNRRRVRRDLKTPRKLNSPRLLRTTRDIASPGDLRTTRDLANPCDLRTPRAAGPTRRAAAPGP